MTDSQAGELTYPGGKLRLHVDAPLGTGARVEPDEQQAHYLLHVMRAKAGDRIGLFNGRDGEWLAHVATVTKRSCSLECDRQTRPQTGVPDLWLCFAPIKKTPADYVVQKATELGAAVLQPVFTRRTIVTRVNRERMRANAVEAAEQSERLTVPDCREPLSFDKLLAAWPRERRLFFCDEGGDALPLADAIRNPPPLMEEGGEMTLSASPARNVTPEPAAIFTGPEGGFDERERETLRAFPFVTPVTLGPRILRADTAALAALTIWQSISGDWR
jgi:16S rRNA (uracil1498-N3)-methyltransferase